MGKSRVRSGLLLACLVFAALPRADGTSPDELAAELRHQLLATAHAKHELATTGVIWFYEARNYRPAWTDRRKLERLISALEGTEWDGLLPQDYNVSLFRRDLAAANDDVRHLAHRDIHITHCFLRALLHLRRGKVNPKSLDARWNIEPDGADQRALLEAAIQAADSGQIAKAFDFARPQHPAYETLRSTLRRLRQAQDEGGWPSLPENSELQLGASGPDVQILHRRLVDAGYLPAGSSGAAYDATTVTAVSSFQAEQYLPVTGKLDRATRAALNVTVGARIDQLRVNMERARWILHQIRGDFVLVDVAGFKVHYFRNGKSAWHSRVQVGRAVRQTPIIKSEITHITFNPAWTVPPGIFRKDILPKIRRNSGYLAANRFHVLDASGREVEPDDVDWSNPRGVTLRQDAGPNGALGRIAIRFPNPYMVYLHETPHKELFDKEQRTFSSGCIRVEKPYELASLLLGWEQAEIDRALSDRRTRNVPVPANIPVLLLYWTVGLHDGRVAFKPDPYRKDPATLKALNREFAGAEL